MNPNIDCKRTENEYCMIIVNNQANTILESASPQRRPVRQETEDDDLYDNIIRVEETDPFAAPPVPPVDLQTNQDEACDILNCDFSRGSK